MRLQNHQFPTPTLHKTKRRVCTALRPSAAVPSFPAPAPSPRLRTTPRQAANLASGRANAKRPRPVDFKDSSKGGEGYSYAALQRDESTIKSGINECLQNWPSDRVPNSQDVKKTCKNRFLLTRKNTRDTTTQKPARAS